MRTRNICRARIFYTHLFRKPCRHAVMRTFAAAKPGTGNTVFQPRKTKTHFHSVALLGEQIKMVTIYDITLNDFCRLFNNS